jgi:multiple sugar transport system permease protein
MSSTTEVSLSEQLSSRAGSLGRVLRKHSLPYLLIAPMAILVIAFIIVPIVRNAWMSFFDWYLARPSSHPFIGLDNYREVFTASTFKNSAKVTALYIGVTVPVRFFLALGIALLLNNTFKGRGLARSIIIIPWAVPVVIACLIWVQMLDFQYGIINYGLLKLNLIDEPLNWLSSTTLALPAAMAVNVWKGTPWPAIMLLAGLQSIPLELYEAAMIDGAGAWQKFRYVTLPMLKPVSLIVFLLLVIWTVKDFGIVYVLNKGGPAHATEVLTVFVYRSAFEGLRMGEAAAGGMVLLAVSLIFTIFYLKVMGGEEESVWQ